MASLLKSSARDAENLTALFAPRSIAVIGASSDQRRFGGRPIQYLREAGFEGPVFPVNPGRAEIQGLKAYPSIRDTPEPVDCALLAVSAEVTLQTIEDCVAHGVRSAVLYGAGFSETGDEGRAMQDRVVATARAADMRLLGPNCMGIMNTHARFYGTFASALEEGIPAPGRIAVASQSGGYGGYLMKHLFRRGLGLSQWVTTGNEADVDIGDALHWMVEQDDTDILLAYVEGLRDSSKLIAALAQARRAQKPVVMMKVGRTAEGSAAAASHTASLTGEDAVYDAVFDHYGVHRARTTDELLDIAYALSKGTLPKGPRVGVISISGGIGVQCADFVSDAGLTMGSVPQATQDALRDLVPHCSPRNPIDMTGLVTTNHEIMERTLDAVLASQAFDATLIFLGIAGAAPSMARPLQQAIANAHSRRPDQLVLVSVTCDADMVREYDSRGLLVFEDPSRAIMALAALARFHDTFGKELPEAIVVPDATRLESGRDLNEAEAKVLLASIGIRSPHEALAANADEAARLASEIGFPVAVKVVSANILHKTEVGGVALGLSSADDVRSAVEHMAVGIPQKAPGATIDGYLVSEMVDGGMETIVGIHHDAAFGPVVTFGLGGTMVELMKDTACALAPVSADKARSMMSTLKTAPLLRGWRGAPALDTDALADAISALSVLAVQQSAVWSTIEINPLVVGEKGVVALDAVIQTKA